MGPIDVLLDTDVLIRIWRRDAEAVEGITPYECGLETIACAEFLQGVNHRQRKSADEFIDRFTFIPFTSGVSYRALRLIREFSHNKGLRMADALIAATSLEIDVPLVTSNKKHFDFIKGITLI